MATQVLRELLHGHFGELRFQPPPKRIRALNGDDVAVDSQRIELDGHTLAASTRPVLVFETSLPTRYYLPRDDVRTELLQPSATTTTCAYKGHASYWNVHLGEAEVKDLVWTYEQPLADAHELTGLMAFFDERADVFVDGQLLERPHTPWRDRTDA